MAFIKDVINQGKGGLEKIDICRRGTIDFIILLIFCYLDYISIVNPSRPKYLPFLSSPNFNFRYETKAIFSTVLTSKCITAIIAKVTLQSNIKTSKARTQDISYLYVLCITYIERYPVLHICFQTTI